MALSLAQNAIAFLIDLAEQGEIDPWDVNVIDVIDRFLSQLRPDQTPVGSRAIYESNLSESGQAFLYASMLVLLKADDLARQEEQQQQDETELMDDLLAQDAMLDAPLPVSLERQIRRRAVARPLQNRRVTLPELIAQLEVMASAVAEHKPRIRTRRPRPHSRSKAVRAIAQLAHQENLSEMAEALDRFLATEWEQIRPDEEWTDFETLLQYWIASEIGQQVRQATTHHTEQSDRVGVFWALLFLSAQSKVELEQTEFYQDIRVRSLRSSDTTTQTSTSVVLPD